MQAMSRGEDVWIQPENMAGKRFVNLGGTVAVGEDKPLELKKIATRLMHV